MTYKILKKYSIPFTISKPEMKPNESESDWMKRCVPFVMREGKTNEQAVGQCMGMFNKSIKKLVPYSYTSDEDFDIDDLHVKKGQELKFVLGIVLEPNVIDATTTDKSVGDIYDEEEVRKAAHFFMMNYSGVGNDFMHDGKDNKDLKIVESYIAPDDMILDGQVIRKGTWMMGTLILNNDVWKSIKEGKITGYSIGGTARGKLEST